jgi:hypothetical protein
MSKRHQIINLSAANTQTQLHVPRSEHGEFLSTARSFPAKAPDEHVLNVQQIGPQHSQ